MNLLLHRPSPHHPRHDFHARSVVISYRHHQAEFVRRDLVPVLKAAGAGEIFIDVQRFIAGREVVKPMDAMQNKAAATGAA